ncbi:FKBP-like protein [Backusella circina FSU 941]|nr:FKBP-like protein [Backusella circina FSU 941]
MEPPTKLLGGVLKKPDYCGNKVSSNAKIQLHYKARVWGEEEYYDNTYNDDKPVQYKLGRDKIMKGLEQGIQGMCEGEVRRLLIPADLAYGITGIPGMVPSDTPVVMEVELVSVDVPFQNPYFWMGLMFFGFVYFLTNRNAQNEDQAKVSSYLEKKEQEKKTD